MKYIEIAVMLVLIGLLIIGIADLVIKIVNAKDTCITVTNIVPIEELDANIGDGFSIIVQRRE